MRNRIAHSLPNHIYDAATTVDLINTWDEMVELFHLVKTSWNLRTMVGGYIKFNL